MKERLSVRACFLLICSLLILGAGGLLCALDFGLMTELTEEEQARLKTGEMVYKEQPVGESPWPERHMYSLIRARPIEAAAIFADYEYQPEYVPSISDTKILEKKSPTHLVIEFELDMPFPLPKEIVVNEHSLTVYGDRENPTFFAMWEQLEGKSAKVSRGSAHFEPYSPEPESPPFTIMKYSSYVYPKSIFAELRFVQEKAKNDLIESTKEIVHHIEYVKESEPEFLEKEVEKLKTALRGS
jgi:hypothetical protein